MAGGCARPVAARMHRAPAAHGTATLRATTIASSTAMPALEGKASAHGSAYPQKQGFRLRDDDLCGKRGAVGPDERALVRVVVQPAVGEQHDVITAAKRRTTWRTPLCEVVLAIARRRVPRYVQWE